MMGDLLAYASAGTGFLAVLGTVVTKWVDARIKNEARLREQLLSRIESLETALTKSADRIAELEVKALSRDHDIYVLKIRLESTELQLEEALDRAKAGESATQALMTKLVSWVDGDKARRSITPSDFPLPQPHMMRRKMGGNDGE